MINEKDGKALVEVNPSKWIKYVQKDGGWTRSKPTKVVFELCIGIENQEGVPVVTTLTESLHMLSYKGKTKEGYVIVTTDEKEATAALGKETAKKMLDRCKQIRADMDQHKEKTLKKAKRTNEQTKEQVAESPEDAKLEAALRKEQKDAYDDDDDSDCKKSKMSEETVASTEAGKENGESKPEAREEKPPQKDEAENGEKFHDASDEI